MLKNDEIIFNVNKKKKKNVNNFKNFVIKTIYYFDSKIIKLLKLK